MSEIEDVIVKIHATPHKSVLVAAGAGSSAMSWLLGVSGASRTLLETLVPYGRFSMIDLVGQEPAQYVSPEKRPGYGPRRLPPGPGAAGG